MAQPVTGYYHSEIIYYIDVKELWDNISTVYLSASKTEAFPHADESGFAMFESY
jgi:hypothetical protein